MISKSEAISKSLSFFDKGYACSQSVLLAYAEHFGLDEQAAKLISSTFGGGMGRLRQKCGAVTGGFMVLGLAFGNEDPEDQDKKLAAYDKVQLLNQQFEDIHKTSICAVLLEKYATAEEIAGKKHYNLICRRAVGDVAGLLHDILSEK